MNIKEKTEESIKDIDPISLLAKTVGEMAVAIQTQNDVLLVLLHNLDLKIPDWKTKLEIEEEIGPKIKECVEAIRRANGPSKVDKG